MGSRGSVIPLFLHQIQEGVPLTVTDPSMTRFLMTLPDATDLVLFALTEGHQGDLFIRKALACTIGDLAQAMLTLFQASNPIRIIGIRHGEKKYETLATIKELLAAKDLGDYYRVRMDTRDLNYNKYLSEGEIPQQVLNDYTSDNTHGLDVEGIMQLLRQLPEIQVVLKD
jgi:UDP-N-acetylglucosamine 4,6-dehydratase